MKIALMILFAITFASAAEASMLCKSADGSAVGYGPAMVYKGEATGYVPVYTENGRQPLGILLRGHYYYPARCTINGCLYKSPTLKIRLESRSRKLIVQRPGEIPIVTALSSCREPRGE